MRDNIYLKNMLTMKTFSRAQLNAAVRTLLALFGHRTYFTGSDVGYRWAHGKKTDELCVRVHIDRKVPLSTLASCEIFPKTIDGIPLDVIPSCYCPNAPSADPNQRRPERYIMGGLSCSRDSGGIGTVGGVVIDLQTGTPAILSSGRVLAGPDARVGDKIFQKWDLARCRSEQSEIARLQRWMLDGDGDAAIATLSHSQHWLPIQYGSYRQVTNVRSSRLGEILQKYGHSMAPKVAQVDGEGIYRLRYEIAPGRFETRDIHGFRLVTLIDSPPVRKELPSTTDSGAIWTSPGNEEAVGLHFAGAPNTGRTEEIAIACSLPKVLRRLAVRMATYDDLLSISQAERPPDADATQAICPDWRFPKNVFHTGNWPWLAPKQAPT